jgi:hypothetical protein
LLLSGALGCGAGFRSFDFEGLHVLLAADEGRLTEFWRALLSGGFRVHRGCRTRLLNAGRGHDRR